MSKPFITIAVKASLLVAAVALSGCGAAGRIANIGKAPDLAPIEQRPIRPQARSIAVPMPTPEDASKEPNSLWRTGARAFFKDQRASDIGYILTVMIEINDQADIENSTTRSRSNAEDADVTNFLGFEGQLANILPDGVNPASLTSFGSNSSTSGAGEVGRSEDISLTVAAIVTQVLPNGNLVIEARQEVRVNFEVRELLVAGIVRPEDIASDNTIQHSQIAEARVSYGGRGQITDLQQPRYGQQLYDIIFPF